MEPSDRVAAAVDGDELELLASGWESDIYALDEERVLRIYHGDAAADKCRREHEGLRLLAAHGYPVPEPHLAEPEAGPAILIMERISS